MKFFAVFAAIVSVAVGSQASWTLNQLSDAIQSPYTDPTLLPHLEHALNEMMAALYSGNQIQAVAVTIPSIDLSTWTLPEISNALQNPHTDAALVPYLEQALNQLMVAIVSEDTQQVAPVVVPAMDVSFWTLAELTAALGNPTTNPALVPYIENAINEIAYALINGQQMESIVIATPAGLLAVEESPAPVPVAPAPVESPIEIPSESPIAPSSPLVQIIVNINQQAAGVVPSPVIVPEAVKPEPIEVQPVQVVETPAVVEPVQVVETPAVVEPVQVVETPAVMPVIVANPALPIQVVETPAVVEPVVIDNPQFIPINPVDILHPIPVVHPVVIDAPVVGPIV